MSEQESQPLPNVPFAIPELQSIADVIRGYVKYLQSLSPPPQERIHVLEGVEKRLRTQLSSGAGAQIQMALDAVNSSSQLTEFTKLLSDPHSSNLPTKELLTPTTTTSNNNI